MADDLFEKKNIIKPRKLAGFFAQIRILFWKNGKLLLRNKTGTFAELFMALLFVLMLLLIRFFVDASLSNDDNDTDIKSNPELDLFNNVTLLRGRYKVYYYPNNVFIQGKVVAAMAKIYAYNPNFTVLTYGSNVSSAENLDATTLEGLYALYSFPDTYTSAFPNAVTYNVYTPEQDRLQYKVDSQFYNATEYMYSDSPHSLCRSVRYFWLYNNIFNPLKFAMDSVIIEALTGTAVNTSTQVKVNRFHCPSYTFDIFKTRFSFFPVLLIQFAYMFSLVVNVGSIILEKSSKMKEYLKLLGVKWYNLWLTWFLRIFIPFLLLTLIIAAVSKFKLSPRDKDGGYEKKAVFDVTDFFVVFSILFVYSLQSSMFGLLLGQLFSKPFVGKTVTVVLWVMTAFDFYGESSSGLKYFMTIFPNCGLLFIMQTVFQYERSSVNLSMSKLYVNIFNDPVNIGGLLALMVFWTIVYIPIAWYIERIFPGEYGAPLPFYFPFMKSYWFKSDNQVGDLKFTEISESKPGFEKDPNLKCTVSIKNISKQFRIGFKDKTVVNNLSINFYENQITGLLGHNGAGKTTTTFMLCGIYAPDDGTAYILGSDIKYQMDQIRTSLGFCPQHDILYDNLTVAEHIDLVSSIKGYTKKEIEEEIKEISKLVGLHNDLEKKSKQLSGGMKRRLSVAMALTGGAKIIILDEPTSGLDPFNRRGLWELIRKFKKNRSIILTTHFMEEADALSDRIAIMNHGQVKCAGSPLYLKSEFGSGYRVVLAKNNSFKEDAFKSLLKSSITSLNVDESVETNIAAEMTIAIPFNKSSELPNFLSKLDSNKESVGVDGYGISSPTIEEVFIKIGSIDTNDEGSAKEYDKMDDGNSLNNAFSADFTRNSGFSLILQQTKALFLKRFFIFFRRTVLAIFILSFPLVAEVLLAAVIPGESNLINQLRGIVINYGSNKLNLDQYKSRYEHQQIPYYVKNNDATLTGILNNYHVNNVPGATWRKFETDTINSFVLEERKKNMTAFLADYFTGLKLEYLSSTVYATIHYSSLAFHSGASMLNTVDNIILQAIQGDNSKSIQTNNFPIASTNTLSNSNSTNYLELLACLDSLPVSLLNFINSVIVAFIISVMVMAVTREKTNGSKQLQLLSGTHYSVYWFANYLFDYCICFIQIVTLVIGLKVVDAIKNDTSSETYAIAGDETLGYFMILLMFSALAWCTLAYIWSFFFRQDIVGFIVLLIILCVIAFIDMILTFIELLFQQNNGGPTNGGAVFVNVVRWILVIFLPNLLVKRGMYDLKIRKNDYCLTGINRILYTEYKFNEEPFSVKEPGIGALILVCIGQFIIGNFILYLMEARPWKNFSCKKEVATVEKQEEVSAIEDDVQEEINRIGRCDLKIQSATEPLIINKLKKQFIKGKTKFMAVNNLSLGVLPQECFGLLGLNGAGKTTTFKILTGELTATSGEAFINGYDISKERSKARRSLGFCPQFDYLPEYLTVEETFELYAGLRGLDSSKIPSILNDMIKVFKLNEMTKKRVQDLSGGNKRKVSAAVGFIGRPSVVILDEPTTGMDPAARRYLWTVIKRARDMGMTIVLTTHSMEESEALSTKLGIMVNGQFKCYGSVQHLKNKFGKGYSMIVKCKHQDNLDEQIKKIEEFVESKIRFSKLTDKQEETLFYQISCEDVDDASKSTAKLQSIAELFTLIEGSKAALNLETYSLSQTSLEQVFLSFAKEQRAENKKEK